MAKRSKTLEILALKLSLSEDEKVLSKAAEFERLLQMKSTVTNITDTAKAVICLDLAAALFRVDVDQKTAIKCSGLKGPAYMNSRKILENILELNNDRLTVSSVCLTLQCNVQELAATILEEYRKSAKMELDMDLPQYVCMAVYQACRLNKIKVSKTKFIDKAQLKSAQWTKLDAEWTKFCDEKIATMVKNKKGRSAKKAVIAEEEKMEIDTDVINKQEEKSEPQVEPYEDWKRRILEEAYKEIALLDQQTDNLKLKDTSNKQKESPSKQKESTSKQKKSPNKQKETPSKQKETPNKQKETSSKQEESLSKQKESLSKQKESPSKQKETPSKQKETPNKQKETPSKQKETPNKQKETSSKQEESLSKQKESLSKQKESLSKQKESPSKQKETPSKQKETPNKQKENMNKQTQDVLKLNFSDLLRRSPRKTPQKFEPYKSPIKDKGVRLLFPL